MRLLLFVLLSIALACRAVHPPPAPPQTSPACTHSYAVTLHGDPSFTEAERDAISNAAEAWQKFSNGRVRIDAVFEGKPTLFREAENGAVVTAIDERNTERRHRKSRVLGWTTEGMIHLVPERIQASALRSVLLHEFGHLAGLRWPGCDERTGDDCDHSGDEDAIMYLAIGEEQKDFNASDLEFCRASCLCP